LIEWTRVRLTQWGRYCRGGSKTGYPTASAFVHADEGGRGGDDCSPMPTELQEVEDCVRRMSWSLAGPVHAEYIWRGPRWYKAVQLRISLSTYKRRLRSSEEWIDRQLVTIAKPVDADPRTVYKGSFSGYCVQR
jgi:hypothetical protein